MYSLFVHIFIYIHYFIVYRVEDLDRELKNLRLAYTALQGEQAKRDLIVDQTSRALSLVEEENHKFQQVSR